MSAPHTPGPWMAAAAPSGIVGWPIVGPGGRSVANVSWSPNHWQAPEEEYAAFVATCEANARLIAAAPELLEAVQRARRHAENVGITDGSYIAQLNAAIAKATGGAS